MAKKIVINKKSRQEVLSELESHPKALKRFLCFSEKNKEQFIRFAMGEQGIPITYNNVFLMAFNPRIPEKRKRLERLLSSVLGKHITIVKTLDREGIHITEKSSFVIVDLLVQDEEGNFLNIEMQKQGYAFPLQRNDCYVSDIIMRQYDELKTQYGKEFNYSKLNKVVTIVFMEKSHGDFLTDTRHYIHHRYPVFDTDIDACGLYENYYICLDIYREHIYTTIKTERDAWMVFLSDTSISNIMELCRLYPMFVPIYEEIFRFRRDVMDMVDFYAEALQIMDHNTEVYMVEEKEKKIQALSKELSDSNSKLSDTESELSDTKSKLSDTESKLSDTKSRLSDTESKLSNFIANAMKKFHLSEDEARSLQEKDSDE